MNVLKAFAAQGASILRVAAALRRRKRTVLVRAKKLGCPFPPLRVVRQKWANTPNNVDAAAETGLFGALAVLTARYVAVVLAG